MKLAFPLLKRSGKVYTSSLKHILRENRGLLMYKLSLLRVIVCFLRKPSLVGASMKSHSLKHS